MKEPSTQLPLFDFDPENLDHSRTSAGHTIRLNRKTRRLRFEARILL